MERRIGLISMKSVRMSQKRDGDANTKHPPKIIEALQHPQIFHHQLQTFRAVVTVDVEPVRQLHT
jgi:hypothetical protein